MVLDRVLRTRLFADVDDRLADRRAGLARGAQVVEVVRHLMKFLRADNQVHVGQLVEQRSPAVLRHTPEDPEDEIGILLFSGREVLRLTDGFLFGGVAHGTGVEQQDVAVVFIRHDAITPGAQHGRDRVAIALVHLTPVGFNVDPIHFRKGCG